MTKGKIITLSIILGVLLTIIILFSFVFCLYGESVYYIEELDVSTSDIVEASGLKHGTPILFINKDKAINRIEATYPHIRVEAIKTRSVRSIEIVVSRRKPVYYIVSGEQYCTLDEDAKVIEKLYVEPNNLIKLNLEIGEDIRAGEFVLDGYRDVLNELYNDCYTYIKLPNDSNIYDYLTREEICSFIRKVEFADNHGLTITLNNQLTIQINNYTDSLDYKINLAFSTYRTLYDREANNGEQDTIGARYSISISYDNNGSIVAGIHNL